jgi:hypothetical protein
MPSLLQEQLGPTTPKDSGTKVSSTLPLPRSSFFWVPRKVQSTTVAEELPFSSALLSVSTVPLQQVLRTPGRVVP